MDEYQTILRRAGLVLVVIGVLDIGWMIYAIQHGQNYSSSFNVFAVIVGVLIMRGSVRVAGYATWFLTLMLTAFVILVSVQLLIPVFADDASQADTLTYSSLFSLAALSLIAWLVWQLTQPAVLDARAAQALPRWRPALPVILGTVLGVFGGVITFTLTYGDDARRATAAARAVLGDEYAYSVESINWGGDSISAHVRAVNGVDTIDLWVDCAPNDSDNVAASCKTKIRD